jgi:hypothetical protein
MRDSVSSIEMLDAHVARRVAQPGLLCARFVDEPITAQYFCPITCAIRKLSSTPTSQWLVRACPNPGLWSSSFGNVATDEVLSPACSAAASGRPGESTPPSRLNPRCRPMAIPRPVQTKGNRQSARRPSPWPTASRHESASAVSVGTNHSFSPLPRRNQQS